MSVYLDIVIVLNFLVDLLLILGANRLAGFPSKLGRCIAAAAIGGLYGGGCLLPGFRFLGNTLWRLVFLGIMGVTAFGWDRNGFRRSVFFIFLNMALGGIVQGMGGESLPSLLLGMAVLCLLCVFGFQGLTQQEFVEVELWEGDKNEKLLALRDTGNGLKDPVTGQSVLVADAKTAEVLFGLTRQQLRSPVETVAAGIVPGMRLIPYRAVGQPAGMLVAIRIKQVRIGSWQGSAVVAFAPDGLGEDHTYRALTGGMA